MSNHKPLRVSETSWILEQLFTAGVTEEAPLVTKVKRQPKAKVVAPVVKKTKAKVEVEEPVAKVLPKQKAPKTVKAKPAAKIAAPIKKTKTRKRNLFRSNK